LFAGAEIPDMLYVNLYIAKLRITYAYKNRQTLKEITMKGAKEELDLDRSLANLQEELRLMQDPESKVKRKKKRTIEVVENEISECQKALDQCKTIENNGWILIDFPTNFSQAMLLEKALSGY